MGTEYPNPRKPPVVLLWKTCNYKFVTTIASKAPFRAQIEVRCATQRQTRLDVIVSLVLLSLLFALTGMRTRLDLLSGYRTWLWTPLILTLAIGGKVGGAVIAARWMGQGWRNSLALGALLNTRGLVELIVLKIAYDSQVFSPTLFTMLVVMALVTTMTTVPALNLLKVGQHSASSRRMVVSKAA